MTDENQTCSKTPLTEDADYLKELAEYEAGWEALEKQMTLYRAQRRRIVQKRRLDYVLRYKGKFWIHYKTIRGEQGGFGWANISVESSAVWRADTEKRAFWYARSIENLKNIIGIEVVPVEKK